MRATVGPRVRREKKQKQGQGPTFRFTQALPQGLTPKQAKQQALDAVAALAEGAK